ncbi:hypothetical protein PMAYCL1PPCAC_32267, partial [Pristionchus mayeri]
MEMARESRDEELEFVLAFSKKTFLEEEQRRIANENDLIHLEGGDLQERERQETIRQIKRLYSHPSNLNALDQNVPQYQQQQQLYPTPAIGWSPLPTSHSPVQVPYHGQLQHVQLNRTDFIRSTYFPASSHSFYPLIASPSTPLPAASTTDPRIKRTSESATTTQHYARPNWPAQTTSFSHLPTASCATPPPPLPTRRASPNEGPPHRPAHASTATLPATPRLSTVIPPQDECPSIVREIYVPYCSIGTPRMVNGDLIDLDGASSPTTEDIWREFDPLYREEDEEPVSPTLPLSSIPAHLHASSSTSAIETTPQRTRSVALPRDIVRHAHQRKSLPSRPTAEKK